MAEVLAGAMALPAEDQARLCSLLQRLTADSSCAASARSSADGPSAVPGSPGQEAVQDWLAQIAREPAWTRLLLLEDALENIGCAGEASVLQAARSALLQANPATAVRHAVVALASQHPIAVCVGVVGLAVAVSGLARVLLRLVF
ncbi:hypothetical protein [Ramlibacter sp. AN1133]|uniref:hypothetical protein n=1 Tax=Ramlibacter sp. AN1133 TaxID=3133429 RepID=UPI0030C2481F